MLAGTRGANRSLFRVSSYTRRTLYYVTALLSAVVIISAAASYLVMLTQISKMATERSLLELRRTAAAFSTMFASSIIPAAEQVFETSEINRFIYGSTLTPQQLLTATKFLDRFQLANPLIDSIAVYNSQRATVYSTRYGLIPADDPRNEVLMRIFRQIRSFRLYRFIPRREDGKELLTVILGSPPYSGSMLLGGLVVNVSEAAVRRQLLGRLKGDGSELTILDSSGTILSGGDPKAFGMDAASYPILRRVVAEEGESGTFSIRDGHSASLVSFFREPLVGWTFVSATPNHVLFAGIARWRNEIIVVFAVLLALSMVLAISAGRRVSGPIERLLVQARSLQSDLSELGSSGSHGDDILLIAETLDLLNQRLHDLSTVHRSEERALARTFTRLLSDQTISEVERSDLRGRLFDSASGAVWVLAIVADGIDSERSPGHRTTLLAACRDLARLLRDCAAVLAAGESERGTVAAVLPLDGDDGSFVLPSEVRSAIEAATPFGCSFTIGVSDPTSDPDELSTAYDSAVEAVRYRFRTGSGAIIRQEDKLAAEDSYLLPDEELRRLGENARLLNESAVEETIRCLLDDVLPYSYEDFAFLSQNILHLLERVFADSRAMNGRELARYRTYVLNVKWIETTEDVYKLATDWYRSFVASAREGSRHRLSSFVADVKTVIDQALVDPDLSAKRIAARLKISVNYVRSTFKGATGESISTYITRLRIERCKEFLESSDLPVKEIAEAAGFRNYTYFFTLFKKQTGRTPQEYQRRISIK